MSSLDSIDILIQRPLEDSLYLTVKETTDAADINEPASGNYFTNSRGQKLHYKYYLPASPEPIKKVLIYIHGYIAHVNRPSTRLYGKKLADNGIALFTFDLHGHGYSEGTRAFVRRYEDLLDDAICFLRLVFQSEEHKIPPDAKFRVTGQSMGGAIASALGLLIHGCNKIGSFSDLESIKFLQSLQQRHLGCILLCPALKINLPPCFVQFILKWMIVPIFPASEVPSCLSSNVNQNDLIWKNPRWIEYVITDYFPKYPKGLSWSGNVRFATGQSIINLISAVRDELCNCHFPFIVVHDPDDKVVLFEGTEYLLDCNSGSLFQHELIEMKGSLHDLLTNEIDCISNLFVTSFQ